MTLSNFDRNGFEPRAEGSKAAKVSVELTLILTRTWMARWS